MARRSSSRRPTARREGRDAIRSLPEVRPDAVLLDVLMPGLDGLEVCRRMRDTGDEYDVLHANYWISGAVGHRLKHALDLPLVATFRIGV